MSDNLFSFFRHQFSKQNGKTFLTVPGGETISYGDVVERTGRLANLFRHLGVKPGDRIAAQTDKSADALLVYLAALRAGAVYLPLNPAYTVGEVRYFLGDATPALFLCRPEDESGMRELTRELGVPRLQTLGSAGEGDFLPLVAGQAADFDDVARRDDDLAAILYTSGTTGRSKGAMLTHGNLRSNAETLKEYWRFTSADRLLHALPIFHTHGLFVATNTIMAAGASMIFLPRFDAAELVRQMPESTVLMGVPTFYARLLAEPGFTRDVAAHMRLFISGSAPLSAETHNAFSALTGHAILERYGMTETNMNTSNPYEGERVPGSVGFPLPDVELRIADPEKTAEEFRPDGFFITGDLGHVDERGYVFIDGRAKDLIISGGFNVYPAEVEGAIDAIPGIAESAVIGVPHPDLGEAVVAIVQSRDDALDEQKVVAALAEQLARYKQPRRVLFLPELPRNAMGKIQKKLLREDYCKLFAVVPD
jgi:malonyl-CoA/methylmalonyl-CoA synthetase